MNIVPESSEHLHLAPPVATIEHQDINLKSLDHAVTAICGATAFRKPLNVFTLNVDHMVKLRRDPEFRDAYQAADFVTADGWPVAWLARRQGADVERTTGADLVEPLCAEAEKRGLPIYIVGASQDSLDAACAYLRRKFPKLDICGAESPSYGLDVNGAEANAVIERVAQSGAALCFVAMGAPLQERFAARAKEQSTGPIYLCVGAAIDFLSGHQSRAPGFFRRNGMEWLWRLSTNPVRLGRRYWDCLCVLADVVVLRPLRRGRQQGSMSA